METYRVDNPGGAVPCWCIDSGPQIEEENSSVTATSDVIEFVLGRFNNVDVCSNNPHADGARDGTSEKEITASELIDEEEQPDEGHNSLDDTKNTRRQIDRVSVDTQALL